MTASAIREIRTIEDLEQLVSECLSNPMRMNESILEEIRYNLKPIVIRITDSGYTSSIGTSVMGPIVKYQQQIYNMIKLIKYDSTRARLSPEDKVGFEIHIEVREGSDLLNLDMNQILQKAFDMMNGEQMKSVMIAGMIIFGIVSAFRTAATLYSRHKERILEKERLLKSQELSNDAIKQSLSTLESVSRMMTENERIAIEALDSLSNTKGDIEIDGEAVSKLDLCRAASERRQSLKEEEEKEKEELGFSSRKVRGKFRITEISMPIISRNDMSSLSGIYLTLMNTDGNEGYRTYKNVKISEENLTESQKKLLIESLDGKIFDLEMICSFDGKEEMLTAYILSCNGEVFKDLLERNLKDSQET